MATITNGKELRRVMRLGRDIILADPTTNRATFRTELEAQTSFDIDDWDTVENVLLELEYVNNANFNPTRNFWRDASNAQARATRNQAEAFFPTSVAAQRASLTLGRDRAVVERNSRRDLIRDHYAPFITSPPVGVSSEVVDGLRAQRTRTRAEQDAFNRLIDQIDNQLTNL